MTVTKGFKEVDVIVYNYCGKFSKNNDKSYKSTPKPKKLLTKVD